MGNLNHDIKCIYIYNAYARSRLIHVVHTPSFPKPHTNPTHTHHQPPINNAAPHPRGHQRAAARRPRHGQVPVPEIPREGPLVRCSVFSVQCSVLVVLGWGVAVGGRKCVNDVEREGGRGVTITRHTLSHHPPTPSNPTKYHQHQVAPRAVYTTGKGASAVGLTAGAYYLSTTTHTRAFSPSLLHIYVCIGGRSVCLRC